MDFNYFDLIVCIIILLLGLKGIINGFFKELFGLVGIIGGIFVASRVGDSVGLYLSDLIFKFDNQSAIGFTGFLATLAVFWILMIFLGMVFKKLSSLSGLGAVDKLLGFFFGVGKFFFIAAVIVHALYNINAIRSQFDDVMKNSFMFPIMDEVGGFIMKLDPVIVEDKIKESIEENKEEIQTKLQKSIIEATNEATDDAKNQIMEKLSDINQSMSNKIEED